MGSLGQRGSELSCVMLPVNNGMKAGFESILAFNKLSLNKRDGEDESLESKHKECNQTMYTAEILQFIKLF